MPNGIGTAFAAESPTSIAGYIETLLPRNWFVGHSMARISWFASPHTLTARGLRERAGSRLSRSCCNAGKQD